MKQHRILERAALYQGFLSVDRYRVQYSLFEGGWVQPQSRELMERGRVAAVLPYDPRSDRVLLIEQFRIGAMQSYSPPWLLEVVAGVIEEGETAEALVHREALEEAGCTLQELMPVTEFLLTPGCSTEHCTVFCGRADLSQAGGVHGVAEEGEDILVHVLPAERAVELATGGGIRNAITLIALQWLAIRRLSGSRPFSEGR